MIKEYHRGSFNYPVNRNSSTSLIDVTHQLFINFHKLQVVKWEQLESAEWILYVDKGYVDYVTSIIPDIVPMTVKITVKPWP